MYTNTICDLMQQAQDITQKLNNLEFVHALRTDFAVFKSMRAYATQYRIPDDSWLPAMNLWLIADFIASHPSHKDTDPSVSAPDQTFTHVIHDHDAADVVKLAAFMGHSPIDYQTMNIHLIKSSDHRAPYNPHYKFSFRS